MTIHVIVINMRYEGSLVISVAVQWFTICIIPLGIHGELESSRLWWTDITSTTTLRVHRLTISTITQTWLKLTARSVSKETIA